MSIARSGVFTWTAPRTSSQYRPTSDEHGVEILRAVARDQAPRVRGARGLAEEAHDLDDCRSPAARTVVRSAPQGSRPAPTVLESGAAAGERRRALQCPVAADELPPVACPVRLAPGEIGEGDARSEGGVPWIAREHRAGVGIDLGRHERRGGRARRTQHPFHVGGHRQVPGAARGVAQRQARDLDRIVERHVLQKIGGDAVRRMLEPAVAPAMPRHIGGGVVADRQRRRAPQVAGVVVAQIEHLARTIADRIVRPGRELVLAAVDRPGVAAAFGRHLKAEVGIGDDVDPGRRRRLAGAEDRRHIPARLRRSRRAR